MPRIAGGTAAPRATDEEIDAAIERFERARDAFFRRHQPIVSVATEKAVLAHLTTLHAALWTLGRGGRV